MKSINLKTVSVALIEGVQYVMIEGLCTNEIGNVELRRADNLADRTFMSTVVFSQRELPLTLEHDNKQYIMSDAKNVELHGNYTTAQLIFNYDDERIKLYLVDTAVVIEGKVTEIAEEEIKTETNTNIPVEETAVQEEIFEAAELETTDDIFHDTALKVLEDKLGLTADEIDNIIAAGDGNEAIIDKLLKRCLSEEKDAEESHIEGFLLDMGDRLGFKLTTETTLEEFKKSVEFLKGFKVDTLPDEILEKVKAPIEIFSRFVDAEINTLGNLLDMIEERLGLDVDDLYGIYQQELGIDDVIAKLPVLDNNESEAVEVAEEEPVVDTKPAEVESTKPTIITNAMIGRGKRKNKRNK